SGVKRVTTAFTFIK
ncbi:hypothetical protein, partial [Klebsiella pneumoniae]